MKKYNKNFAFVSNLWYHVDMESLESILFNQKIMARVSPSVRTAALQESVISPGHLF